MSVYIKNGWILTMDEPRRELRNGFIWIEGDSIGEIGAMGEEGGDYEAEADEVIDALGKLVLPGLVNSHTHLFQTYMRGLADDKPLLRWLEEEIWPYSLLMEEEDFYLAALLGCVENIRNGATAVLDQHYIHTSPATSERVLTAMKESGIRASLCRCFADIKYYPKLRETRQQVMRAIDELVRTWHGAENSRLAVSLGPLNPWACSPELFRESYQYAAEHDLSYQIHTAEADEVVERTLSEYGLRNVSLFESLGVLGDRTQLVHSVKLDERELDLIAKRNAAVVHCPVANMYLASGVARIPEMRERGIRIALATDGPGSNNAQDMMEVLKATACLQKVHTGNAMILYPEDVLEMATVGGGEIMGGGEIGKLAPGMKGDCIIVDSKRPHIAPVHRAASALVYNANGNDVDTAIIDGTIVMSNGTMRMIDENALIEECERRVAYLSRKKRGA
jgi:5-methylthioadenosine/S-adenosylhomocysteine deaminase